MAEPARMFDPSPCRLGGALEGLADELGRVRDRLLQLQVCCGPTDAATRLDPALVRELQGLDLLTQSVESLAAFASSVAQVLPVDPVLDLDAALNGAPLTDLADRLRARSRGRPAPRIDDAGAGGGDLQLF